MTQDKPFGRPPAGKRKGERVRDYPPMTLRLPPETRTLLTAWSEYSHVPAWRLIDDAVLAAFKALPESERRKVRHTSRAVTHE